jgi:chromosome segregation ATPase
MKLHWLRLLLLSFVILSLIADKSTFGAVQYGVQNNRNHRSTRTTRTTRSSSTSGVYAAAQKAQAALNAARSEQAAAQRNLISARSTANSRYINTSALAQAREVFKKAEGVHESTKDEVLSQLRRNNDEYKAAQNKLKDLESRLKQSSDPALKAEVRQQRLAISEIENTAFRADAEYQAALKARDAASQQMQILHRDAENSIAKDSSLTDAKGKAAQASMNLNSAQANYGRAVASANAAANLARANAAAQATRPRYVNTGRYGWGGRFGSLGRARGFGYHRPAIRFFRYR